MMAARRRHHDVPLLPVYHPRLTVASDDRCVRSVFGLRGIAASAAYCIPDGNIFWCEQIVISKKGHHQHPSPASHAKAIAGCAGVVSALLPCLKTLCGRSTAKAFGR
jgi:hypothetical protein